MAVQKEKVSEDRGGNKEVEGLECVYAPKDEKMRGPVEMCETERWTTTRLDDERGGRVMDLKVYGLRNLP